MSEGLRGWLVRLGAAAPFREAAEVLDALTGLELGAETIRRHAEAAGTALRAAEDAAVAEVERTREPAEGLDPAPGFLVVQTDGAMVRYQDGWHEVKLGLVAGWDDGALQAPSYVAAREPAAACRGAAGGRSGAAWGAGDRPLGGRRDRAGARRPARARAGRRRGTPGSGTSRTSGSTRASRSSIRTTPTSTSLPPPAPASATPQRLRRGSTVARPSC